MRAGTLRRASSLWRGLTGGQQRGAATVAFERIVGQPHEPAESDPAYGVLIHGLLGSGRNWRTWTRKITAAAAEETHRPCEVLLVDQRCHGASAHRPELRPPHTIQSSAADMTQLAKQECGGAAPRVVIGHSLGGKVALEWLRQLAADDQGLGLPQQVWVLDSNVGRVRDDARTDVERVVEEVAAIPLPVPSRKELVERMRGMGFSETLAQWLASSLVPIPGGGASGGLTWAFDIKGAASMLVSYRASEYWDLLAAPPCGVTVNVVRAARSDRWSRSMLEQLREAEASSAANDAVGTTRYHELADAGHWVHVDNPTGLTNMVLPSMVQAAAC